MQVNTNACLAAVCSLKAALQEEVACAAGNVHSLACVASQLMLHVQLQHC